MITVVIAKNPIEANFDREIRHLEQVNIADLKAEFEPLFGQVVIQVNGNFVTENVPLKDGDFVGVTPYIGGGGGKDDGKGGKSILGLVATVAIAVVSFGVGGMATGYGMWGAGMGLWTTGGYIAAAATMFIGAALVQRACYNNTSSIDIGNYDYENNATYTWGNVETMEGQNNPIALTYGKAKSAGQTIAKHVTCDGTDEYLNWLVSGGEGQLSSISEIKLNNQSVGNYSAISCQTRLGTNTQSIINGFGDTYSTHTCSYELKKGYYGHLGNGSLADWTIVDIPGNATTGIRLSFSFPQGLYSVDRYDGSFFPNIVNILIWYTNEEGTQSGYIYNNTSDANKNVLIWRAWGEKTNAKNVQAEKRGLPAGHYKVYVRMYWRLSPESDATARNTTYLTSVSSIVEDDFTYPNIALIGITAKATGQLSGSPTLSFLKERESVYVWNPTLETYQLKPANNPAWAAYDMLHQCHLLNKAEGGYVHEVRGVPAANLIYEQFNEWATWCYEHNKTINIEVNSYGEMLKIINEQIAPVGHGMVVRFGTKYGCVYDHVQQPTQLFGMGNIVTGTFKEEFLKTTDRANCVEVTYTDKDMDWERNTIKVYGSTYDTDPEERSAQITYNGVNNYQQAYREGMYHLYCNQYLVRTVSFDTTVEALSCTIGDVVLVAHDVPQWCYSGRVSNVTEDGKVTLPIILDRSLTSNYKIQYRTDEDVILESAVTVVSATDSEVVITFNTTPTTMIAKDNVFAFGLVDYSAKPFTVKNMKITADLNIHMELLEYNESIYDETYTIPEIEYTPPGEKAQDVSNLQAVQGKYCDGSGVWHNYIDVSWEKHIAIETYNIYYSRDCIHWELYTEAESTSDTNIRMIMNTNAYIYIKVVTIVGNTRTRGAVVGVEKGINQLPPDITALYCEMKDDGSRVYTWDFVYPNPNDIKGFRIKYIAGEKADWDNAIMAQGFVIASQPYVSTAELIGGQTVMIKAVDNAGNESKSVASCYVNFGDPVEQNVVSKIDLSANKWSGITWTKFVGCQITDSGVLENKTTNETAFWGDQQTLFWDTLQKNTWSVSHSDMVAEFSFVVPATGDWWLTYDMVGAMHINYKFDEEESWGIYSGKVKVTCGQRIYIQFTSSSRAELSNFVSVVDVPDRTEKFKNLTIPTTGLELPIKTPNYYTTAVRVDSVPLKDNQQFFIKIDTNNPCKIKAIYADGTAIEVTGVNVTWQGYEKEVL